MPASRFLQVRSALTADIHAGKFASQLPPEPALALSYGVSRMTLRRAIAGLVSEGLLSAQQGRGTFIRSNRPPATSTIVGLRLEAGVLAGSADPYFSVMISALADHFSRAGYTLSITGSETDSARPLAGLVALSYNRDSVWNLAGVNLPLILLDAAPLPDRTCVLCDNRQGITLAVEHLYRLGHRRIGHLAGVPSTVAGQERVHTWRSALGVRDLASPDSLISEGGFTVDGGSRGMAELLNHADGRPTAVVCANDRMALGAMRLLRERQLRVPDDISLIGFDDIDAAELAHPALTTISVPRVAMAAAACQALINEITDPAATRGQTIRLPVSLTVRGTTAAAPAP